MKLNWVERWVVNNPLRVFEQGIEIRRLKQMLPLRPGFTALEIGCGRGAGAKVFLREFKPSRIHAMDVDMAMIGKAKRYLSHTYKQKISLFAGDASALPVKTQSMDAVIGFGVLHHVQDWRAAIAEIARVLKPDGVYFLEELYPSLYQNFITRHILLHPTSDRFTGDELRKALADVNFFIKDCIEWKRLGIFGTAIKSGEGTSFLLDGESQACPEPAYYRNQRDEGEDKNEINHTRRSKRDEDIGDDETPYEGYNVYPEEKPGEYLFDDHGSHLPCRIV